MSAVSDWQGNADPAPRTRRETGPRWLPAVTFFLTGMGMMTAQLAAGRLLAGELGQSLYTWTAVIGVFLAGLALGNVAGGRLADRLRGGCEVRKVLCACALATMLMLPLNVAAGALPWWPACPPTWRILLHAAVTFLPAAFTYGMVSPLLMREALVRTSGKGKTFGRLYAWGVAGNLAGTFLTGFVLFALVSVTTIVYLAAAMFLLPAIGYFLSGPTPVLRLMPPADAPPAGPRRWHFPRAWRPYALAATTGAAIMVLELAAGRLLGQNFGQSLYTWTAAIGVVFAGMSLGAWGGGRLADRAGAWRLLPWLLMLASAGVMAVPWLHHQAGELPPLWTLDLPRRVLAHSLLAFLPPALLAGLPLPAIAAAATADPERTGRSLGGVYAWMSVGSVAGTLLAGFLLFGAAGTRMTVAGAAVLLALGAALAGNPYHLPRYWALFCLALVAGATTGLRGANFIATRLRLREPTSPNVLFHQESAYSLVTVKLDADRRRCLYLDRLEHSIVNPDNPLDLRYQYHQVFAKVLATARPGDGPVRTLVIGGGGYVFPRLLEATRPGSRIEVAEIDPVVTRAAMAECGLAADTAIGIHHGDAGLFVRDLVRRRQRGESIPAYDAIFGDSINHLLVPFHLLTVEFVREVRSLLAPDGVYCLILIDSLANGKMVGAAAGTCRQVFPAVEVFSTHDRSDARDTFILVASAKPLPLAGLAGEIAASDATFLGRLLAPAAVAELERRAGNLVLTANFAPVDRLIDDLVCEDSEDQADIYCRLAIRHQQLGQHAQAIDLCRKALAVRPGWAKIHGLAGLSHAARGDHGLAAVAFNEAARLQPDNPEYHYRLGDSLKQIRDLEGALDAFARAIHLDPNYLEARFYLATLLFLVDDFDGARTAWEAYLELAPEHAEARHRYAQALWRCRRIDQARVEVRRAQALGAKPDPKFLEILKEKPTPSGG